MSDANRPLRILANSHLTANDKEKKKDLVKKREKKRKAKKFKENKFFWSFPHPKTMATFTELLGFSVCLTQGTEK